MDIDTHLFTEEDVRACWDYTEDILVDILNKNYDVEEAREDLFSLIGSKHDPRSNE